MISKNEILTAFDELLSNGECHNLEAKKATDSIGDSVMQTICAFANEPHIGHGLLLLGISEPDDEHDNFWVSGVKDTDKLCNQLQGNCRTQFNVSVRIDAGVTCIDGKQVIAVKVFELEAAAKPCQFISSGKNNKNKSKTGAWRRGVNCDYECSEDELEPILLAKIGRRYEQLSLPDATWDDLDPAAIALYRTLRSKVRPDAQELQASDEDMLYALNLVQKSNGQWIPNIAGLVLLGKPLALKRLLPMLRVDYVRINGTQWVQDPEKRFETTIDFRDSLLRLITRVESTIIDDLPRYFQLEDGNTQRSDKPLLPEKVIREALVNAVMHRDYQVSQPTLIVRYSNRIEILNAGYSLKPVVELGEMGSKTRNETLANVLYDIHFAETKGSGIKTMRGILEQAGISAPLFKSDRSKNVFHATYFLHQLMGQEQFAWLQHFKDANLNGDEAKALVLARETGTVDNMGLRTITGLDTLLASKVLSGLCKKNLLEKHGAGRITSYCLSQFAQEINNKPIKVDINKVEFNTNTSELDSNTSELGSNTSELGSNTSELDANMINLPPQLIEIITSLGKKPKKIEMYPVVIWLCVLRPHTAEELADFLNRKANAFKTAYLSPLREKGLISYIYPQKITHPNQAYQTTEKGLQWLKAKGLNL